MSTSVLYCSMIEEKTDREEDEGSGVYEVSQYAYDSDQFNTRVDKRYIQSTSSEFVQRFVHSLFEIFSIRKKRYGKIKTVDKRRTVKNS